jgi:hypothetical protein
MSRAFLIVLLILALAGVAALELYSHTLSGISSGGPVPLQSIPPPREPTAAPSHAAALPAPRSVPAATATPAPIRSAASPAGTQVAGPPRILGVSLSSAVVTGGQVVTGTVQTSPGVTRVQASIAGYASALQKVSSGYFALSYRVPNLPFFLHRTYTIVVTAQDARGQSVSSSLPITVR